VSTVQSGDWFYAALPSATTYQMTISREGYASENGASANVGLSKLVATNQAQTSVVLSGSAPCATVASGAETVCAALRLNETMKVTSEKTGMPISGATVTYYTDANRSQIADDLSINGMGDATGNTDANGVRSFALASGTYYYKVTAPGYEPNLYETVLVSGTLDSLNLMLKPTSSPVIPPVLPPPPQACAYAIGSLVKLPNDGNPVTQEDTAVYYYGKDCKRHAFSNDKVYFSWYTDFSNVTVVTPQVLASMMLGSNVTYRPGVKMVKFLSVPTVYAVAHGGVLRWVKTEAAATALYGPTWNKKIDDISDAFFVNYSFGTDINASADYNLTGELQAALTIDANL
jgi:hypothetical protein